MTDPIRIRCEGSGYPGNRSLLGARVTCQMCGQHFAGPGPVPNHDRNDILAMIDRGDFG